MCRPDLQSLWNGHSRVKAFSLQDVAYNRGAMCTLAEKFPTKGHMLRSRQNCSRFAENIIMWIINCLIQFSLKFVFKGPINEEPYFFRYLHQIVIFNDDVSVTWRRYAFHGQDEYMLTGVGGKSADDILIMYILPSNL